MKFISQEKGDIMISLMNNYPIVPQRNFTARRNHNTQLTHQFTDESRQMSTGAKIGTYSGVGLAGILCLTNRKKIAKAAFSFKNAVAEGISDFFNSSDLKQVNISKYKDVNLKQHAKKLFLNRFINPIKNPNIVETNTGRNVQVTQRFTPDNGYLVYGPDSKAKEEHFNWVLKELQDAGVEVIDAGKGKSIKDAHMDIYKAWWNMWKNNSDKEFLQNGKYKAFVVRDLDEFPISTGFLKDSPDSNDCCKKHGIMLIYSCKNPDNIDPAVIRAGRVDLECLPEPNADEPLEIWKKYLNFAINEPAALAHRCVESAKEILSKRGASAIDEMGDSLKYSVPYQHPLIDASLEKWQKYVTATSQNPHLSCVQNELFRALSIAIDNCRYSETKMQKFRKIVKMTEEIMPKDKLNEWKSVVNKIEKGKI